MSTIYLRVTVCGERVEIGSTGIKIYTDWWKDQTQRVDVKDPYANFKNEQLGLMETRLLAIYNELLRNGKSITADRIKRLYVRPQAITYLTAFDMFQKEYCKNPKIAESTKDKLKTIKTSITKFLIEEKLQGILVEEFDSGIVLDYNTWCDHQNFKESYILRNIRGIKRITTWTKNKKLIDVDPLEDYVVGREKISKPVYMDSVQLTLWRSHKFTSETCQKVADLFVLYARTGMHYQDLIQVIRDPNQFVITGIDGKLWIDKPRQKTEVKAKIPIHQFPEVKEIIDKYGGWSNVPVFANSTMNDWLKICVADINIHLDPFFRIHPGLSVKHGRSSFCDYCLNELVLPIKAILTMMGRESESELKRYARNDERGVVNGFRISKSALAC